MELKGDSGQSLLARGTTATKSRTVFFSGIENALPVSRLIQNALDEPPSRLSAREILKPSAICTVARIFANSARDSSVQEPSAARSNPPTAAKVLGADRFSSRAR